MVQELGRFTFNRRAAPRWVVVDIVIAEELFDPFTEGADWSEGPLIGRLRESFALKKRRSEKIMTITLFDRWTSAALWAADKNKRWQDRGEVGLWVPLELYRNRMTSRGGSGSRRKECFLFWRRVLLVRLEAGGDEDEPGTPPVVPSPQSPPNGLSLEEPPSRHQERRTVHLPHQHYAFAAGPLAARPRGRAKHLPPLRG